jgi:hypothetical protein
MAHRPWQIRAAAALIDLDQLVACPGGLDEQAQHEDADDMNPARALDIPAGDVTGTLLRSLSTAQEGITPFRHWRFADALPEDAAAAITDLPFLPPCLAAPGRREIVNSTRVFFSAENRLRFPICREVAETLQSKTIVDRLETLCRTDLAGSFLRIEYCQDTDGFWLEPHTDIGAKLFTMLIYLSAEGSVETWGTDLMSPAGEVLATVPYRVNSGVIFIPGSDTWHGFRKRRIDGIRRSLIVNYVKPEWRSRHELAFPDQPVT